MTSMQEKAIFVEKFRGNGASQINDKVPAFLLTPKFKGVSPDPDFGPKMLDKVFALADYFKKFNVLSNDYNNLLPEEKEDVIAKLKEQGSQ